MDTSSNAESINAAASDEPVKTIDRSHGMGRYLADPNAESSGVYLYQDGEFYTLGNSGWKLYEVSSAYDIKTVTPYRADSVYVSTDKQSDEVPTYKDGDQIRLYSSGQVSDLELVKMKRDAYATALRIEGQGSNNYLVYGDFDTTNEKSESIQKWTEVPIVDASGKEYQYYETHGLDKGATLSLSWYVGTKYNEVTVEADYPCYIVDPSLPLEYNNSAYADCVAESGIITIPASLTKNGYAEYDVSQVEPGYYLTNVGGILQIV